MKFEDIKIDECFQAYSEIGEYLTYQKTSKSFANCLEVEDMNDVWFADSDEVKPV